VYIIKTPTIIIAICLNKFEKIKFVPKFELALKIGKKEKNDRANTTYQTTLSPFKFEIKLITFLLPL
jgi:hypothetical protein